jgi:uncharacterized membrane protein
MKSENWIKDAVLSHLGRTATISFFMLWGYLAGYSQKLSDIREFAIRVNNGETAVLLGAFLGVWLVVMALYTFVVLIGFVLGRVTLFISQNFRPYQATEEKRKNDFSRLSDDTTSIRSEVIQQSLREGNWNESS